MLQPVVQPPAYSHLPPELFPSCTPSPPHQSGLFLLAGCWMPRPGSGAASCTYPTVWHTGKPSQPRGMSVPTLGCCLTPGEDGQFLAHCLGELP